MKKKIHRLLAVIEYIQNQLSVTNFEDRLLLQKYVYFAQLQGIDLGYRFTWYHYGPYSPDLTATAFAYHENKPMYDNDKNTVAISDSGKQKLDKVKSLLDRKPDNLKLHIFMELLASIHYLNKIARKDGEITKENVVQIIQEKKPDKFSETDILNAWDLLVEKEYI